MTEDQKNNIDNFLKKNGFFVGFDSTKLTAFKEKLTSSILKECRELAEDPSTYMMIKTGISPKLSKNSSVLALDIGGTNIRKCLIRFDNNGKLTSSLISKTLREGMMNKDFFKELARFVLNEDVYSMDDLLKINHISLCFSYPFKSEKDGDAFMSVAAKGIDRDQFEGRPLIKTLLSSLKDEGVTLKASGTVVNDATSSLLYLTTLSSDKNSIKLGSIVGTGCNVALFDPHAMEKRIICTECGHFTLKHMSDDDGDSHLYGVSNFDMEVDRALHLNGESNFEIVTSGFYIFRVLKVIIRALMNNALIPESDKSAIDDFYNHLDDTSSLTDYYAATKSELVKYLITLMIKRSSLYLTSLFTAFIIYSKGNSSVSIKGMSDSNSISSDNGDDVEIYIEGSTYHLLPLYKETTEMMMKNVKFYYPQKNDGSTILIGSSIGHINAQG